MNSKLVQIATAEIGVREVAGGDHNERILQYARDIGHTWIESDETPWCSIFLNWVAMKAGAKRSDSGSARSWLNVGASVDSPEPGDVVVFWRQSPNSHKGHVGIYLGFSMDQSRVYVLGGNQGDQVGITAYSSERLLGFRRLRPREIELGTGSLKRGDRGSAVVQVQDALRMAGFNPGTSDGIFGPRTEEAVKALQATNLQLEIDGVFDAETREYLLGLVNDTL